MIWERVGLCQFAEASLEAAAQDGARSILNTSATFNDFDLFPRWCEPLSSAPGRAY